MYTWKNTLARVNKFLNAEISLAVIYWVPAMVEHHLCPTHSSSPLYSSEYEKCPKYYEALGDSEGARGGIVPVKG